MINIKIIDVPPWCQVHGRPAVKLLTIFYWCIIDLQCCVSGVQQSESVLQIYIYTLF